MAKSHPGFKAVAAGIAKREGVSGKRAGAILAAATRRASPAAKKANPHLSRVKGKALGGKVGALKGLKRSAGIKAVPGLGRPSFEERTATRMAGMPETANVPGARPYARGGAVHGGASSRADGCVAKGKTRGRFI